MSSPEVQQFVPRNLGGSLIAHKPGGAVRKVVRDDGDNGLWISHPGTPSSMYFITRKDYNENWVFHKHESTITAQDLAGYTFDDRKGDLGQVNLNHRKETTVAEQEATDVDRSAETDREAMKREMMGETPVDAVSDGRPVGANEEPANMVEEDRMDPEEAPAPEPKKRGRPKKDEE